MMCIIITIIIFCSIQNLIFTFSVWLLRVPQKALWNGQHLSGIKNHLVLPICILYRTHRTHIHSTDLSPYLLLILLFLSPSLLFFGTVFCIVKFFSISYFSVLYRVRPPAHSPE